MARSYAAALAMVLVAALLRLALDPLLGGAPALGTFLLAVVVSAWIGGAGPALLSLVVGGIVADYCFVSPRFDLGASDPGTLIAFGTYSAVGLAAIAFFESQRRARRRAELKVEEARDDLTRLEEEGLTGEARFRTLADSAPVLLWMSGKKKEGIYFNRRWLEFRGRSSEEEEGEGWLEGVHPDDLGVLEVCSRAFANREPFQIQFRLRRADGEYRWMLDTGLPRFGPEGAFLGFGGSCLDITDLKATETERQKLLEQLTLLVDASSTLMGAPDPTSTLSRILRLASGVIAADAYAVWRFVREERSWCIVASEGLSERYRHEAVRALKNRDLGLETPLLIEDAEHDPIVAAHREQQRAEGIASLLVVPLRILGENTGTLVFYYRTPHRFGDADVRTATAMANLAAAAIEGALLHESTQAARVRAEHAVGRMSRLQRVTVALSDACTSAEVCDVAVEEGMAAIGAQTGAAGLVTPDGKSIAVVRSCGFPGALVAAWPELPIDAPVPPSEAVRTGVPVFLSDGEERISRFPYLAEIAELDTKASACIPLIVRGRAIGVIAFGFDRASQFSEDDRSFLLALGRQSAQALDRARLYDIEQEARVAAEEANRAKDAFLAMLAHELRNPLVPVWNGLRLLRGPGFDREHTDRTLKSMERQMRQLTRLIDDLLDVSRLTRGKISLQTETCDFGAIVAAGVEDLRGLFEDAGLALDVHLPSDPVWVSADCTRLSQIVGNLLSNAAKFTDKGGRVTVTVGSEEENDSGSRCGVLSVSDTGIGIAPELVAHLFEPFTQADSSLARSRGGLGLGLSLVKGLVELHGGRVTSESMGHGQGAKFVVRLPLVDAPPRRIEETPAREPAEMETPRSILLIEDNVDAALMMQTLFALQGHSVRVAHSGIEGLAKARERAPEIIFCDIGLPGELNGYDVARALRKDGGDLASAYLVALTGYGQTRDEEDARAAGFDLHLTKPVDPDVLAKIIANAPPLRD